MSQSRKYLVVKCDLISQITFVFDSCLIGLFTNVVRFGWGGGRFFFLGRGQHLLAKTRKPRLPRSHEILMFGCLQKDAKQIEAMLQCKPSYTHNIVRENHNKYNSGIAASGGQGGGFRGSLGNAPQESNILN